MTTKEAMIKKLGSEEAYKLYLREIAAKGGKRIVVKGWAARKLKRDNGEFVKPVDK